MCHASGPLQQSSPSCTEHSDTQCLCTAHGAAAFSVQCQPRHPSPRAAAGRAGEHELGLAAAVRDPSGTPVSHWGCSGRCPEGNQPCTDPEGSSTAAPGEQRGGKSGAAVLGSGTCMRVPNSRKTVGLDCRDRSLHCCRTGLKMQKPTPTLTPQFHLPTLLLRAGV